MIQFISDAEHYSTVIEAVAMSRESLWIGTADIKDLYIKQGQQERPFLGLIDELIGRGVEVRLIHAKEPGPNFRQDFDRYKRLVTLLERVMCPRVHFKIIIIDHKLCYIGSANLTGAGMGLKSATRRNFEAGILTDDSTLISQAIEEFDKVWRGSECQHCQRRRHCPDPIS